MYKQIQSRDIRTVEWLSYYIIFIILIYACRIAISENVESDYKRNQKEQRDYIYSVIRPLSTVPSNVSRFENTVNESSSRSVNKQRDVPYEFHLMNVSPPTLSNPLPEEIPTPPIVRPVPERPLEIYRPLPESPLEMITIPPVILSDTHAFDDTVNLNNILENMNMLLPTQERTMSNITESLLTNAMNCFSSLLNGCDETFEPETVPLRPEIVPLQPEPIPLYTERVPLQPETVQRQRVEGFTPETVPLRPETVPLRPETVAMYVENAPLRPETVPLHPESIPLHTQRVERFTPETVPMRPETVPLFPETVTMHTETVPLRPEMVPLHPEPIPLRPEHVTETFGEYNDNDVIVDRTPSGLMYMDENRANVNNLPSYETSADLFSKEQQNKKFSHLLRDTEECSRFIDLPKFNNKNITAFHDFLARDFGTTNDKYRINSKRN